MADLILTGRFATFTGGSLKLTQNPVLRPALGGQPVNFRSGTVRLNLGAVRSLVPTTGAPRRFISGRLTAARTEFVMGSVTKYSNNAGTDPSADAANVLISSMYGGDIALGGPGSAWSLAAMTIGVDPVVTPFVAPGFYFSNSPNSLTGLRAQYIKNVQVELGIYYNGQHVYEPPRQMSTRVIAERINWSANPGLKIDLTNWGGGSRTALSEAKSGFAYGMALAAGATSGLSTHTIPLLYVGKTYRITFKVKSSAAPVKFTVEVVNDDATMVGGTGLNGSTTLTGMEFTSTQATREVTFEIVPKRAPMSLYFTHQAQGGATTSYIFDMLIEKDGKAGAPYFDGDTEGTDAMWETGQTAGTTRSHYYKNRLERVAALNRLVAENVPMGIAVATPLLGVLPSDIAPPLVNTNIYGTGTYDDGTYGGLSTT